MPDAATFGLQTADAILREVANLRQQVRVLSRRGAINARSLGGYPAPPFWAFLKANVTATSPALAPGGSATAYPGRWNSTTNVWESATDRGTFEIHDSQNWAFGLAGDAVLVWQNPLNDRFEVMAPHRQMVLVKPDSTINFDSSGTCSVWDAGSDSGVNITCHLSWADSSQNMSSGKEAIARYFGDESKWRIVGGECE